MAKISAPGLSGSAATASTNLSEQYAFIHLAEPAGLVREGEAVRIGVPLPAGWLRDAAEALITDREGTEVPHQARALALWADRSVRWLLVDALASCAPHECTALVLRRRGSAPEARQPVLLVRSTDDSVEIDTGVVRILLDRRSAGLIASAQLEGMELLAMPGSGICIQDSAGHSHELQIERWSIEEQGPILAAVFAEGGFVGSGTAQPLRFTARLMFVAGSGVVRIELLVRNPLAARHPGGLWDLGDAGSCLFEDLTLSVRPSFVVEALEWLTEPGGERHGQPAQQWSVYQDSSGGAAWQSPNHLDRSSRSTVSFRGYRVKGPGEALLEEGSRATPVVTAGGAHSWIAVAAPGFWQNFPKALRWSGAALEVGLFPTEARSEFELQGGEQKRHAVLVEFGRSGMRTNLAQLQQPLRVSLDPAWVESTGAVSWLSAAAPEDHAGLAAYLGQIVAGPHSFFAKREIIDEYGWRNFGDLYADHEAVHHRGPQPFVSHYNNQYDFVYGAFVQFLRSGDDRWRELMHDAARHHIDIDVYHTQSDKPTFNGGLFWHTDHYKPAATCTHRTYSRHNATSSGYGGGPSNEHNYTSGLLYHYYLSGDREAARTVRELADWVLAMDDGTRTLFGVIDQGATGSASRTLEHSYHHPGRGAGNSINALLDAYALTRERPYLSKAEEILQRCVHPLDDIGALGLDDPEHRWSYLVFLQVLGKYLTHKREMGEIDYAFHYARASLLHYARWVAEHEVPYKDVLHKVELPTETWPAHDIRKSHVLHLAAAYSSGAERLSLLQRAEFFFERCLADLTGFPTAHFTRPLVILCVYGPVHDYFRRQGPPAQDYSLHNYEFGVPAKFVPQRARLKSALRARVRVTRSELSRLVADKVSALRARLVRK